MLGAYKHPGMGHWKSRPCFLQERLVSGAWEPPAPVAGVGLRTSQPRGSSHGAVQGGVKGSVLAASRKAAVKAPEPTYTVSPSARIRTSSSTKASWINLISV